MKYVLLQFESLKLKYFFRTLRMYFLIIIHFYTINHFPTSTRPSVKTTISNTISKNTFPKKSPPKTYYLLHTINPNDIFRTQEE